LWIAIALLIGVGLGNLIGSSDPSRIPAAAASVSDVDAARAHSLSPPEAPPPVSAARTQNEVANALDALDGIVSGDESEAIVYESRVEKSPRGSQQAAIAPSTYGTAGGVKRDATGISRYAAIPIDMLPVHRPESFQPDPPAEPQREIRQTSSPQPNRSRNKSGAFTIVTRGEIAEGESLGSSLGRQGISSTTVHRIDREMRKVFDFRHSRPGDRYRLGQDAEGRVLDFRYSQNPEESYYMAWEGSRYGVRKETAELHAQVAKIAGVVDSSFYGAIVALGEQSALASEFARIFAWDIDFSRNVHPGDEFSILYERLYRRNPDGEEVYVRPGRILAGRYAGKTGPHTIVYFEDDEEGGAYFRPDGTSVERAFLAAPLEFSRISSRFTRARQHPILKITRPHPGIDYAAPHGTPVYAVAEGVVEYKARAGASGNLVRIRHAGGYSSHYAHLSRFEKSLEVGDRVQQREVIGYVGSSGLSTGPHVCFRVKKDGHYVDPMKISSPPGQPVERVHLAKFQHVRDQLLANLGPAPVNLADEAL
jgi:murein DD-endopeptidase MepM/ murein hydrolase activator NlpD